MYEYIVTIFKVVAGVITNERLVIASLIAFGLLLLWVIFSLCFSFEMRFLSGARKINEYISRNGISGQNRAGLLKLVQQMPSEFVHGFATYEKNPHDLPSRYIKRSDCLDLELNGGVFNQNRSVMKSYINLIFVALSIFSFAILSSSSLVETTTPATDTPLTGYMVAQALLLPLLFLAVSKILYYVYTAIRQHQYHVAVEEFNDMIDNLDKAAMDTYGYLPANVERKAETIVKEVPVEKIVEVPVEKRVEVPVERIVEKRVEVPIEKIVYVEVPRKEEKIETEAENKPAEDVKEENVEVLEKQPTEPKLAEEIKPAETEVKEEVSEPAESEAETTEKQETEETASEEKEEIKDNFKPDFSSLLDEPVQVKRGRGRPKKEVTGENGFVIKTDKDFEEALVRAEKLMRKNEEPLSPSQTKRIEKQLKELIDAMQKYKENK